MLLASLDDDRLASLSGGTLAVVAPHNPLATAPAEAAAQLPAEAPRVIGWSGSLGDSLFGRAFATWMPAGRDALAGYLDAALSRCRDAGTTLLLRTHARHVVSDAVAARAILDERAGEPLGVAFDPAACFEAEMLRDAQDHLVRLFELAGPLADVIILRSLAPPMGAGDLPAAVALGEGLLDAGLLGRLVKAHGREGVIVAVAGPDPELQLAAAGLR